MLPNVRYLKWPKDTPFRKLEQVDYLVVHHTASQHDPPIEEVDRDHRENKGWLGVGYHFLIRRDGSVEGGRPEWAVGAHVQSFNDCSLGVALNGDFMVQVPTPEQMASLVALLKGLLNKYPKAKVVAHRHLRPTNCPGVNFPWDDLQQRLQPKTPKDTPSPWAATAWQKATAKGILDGTRPHDPLTREELAVVLDRLGLLEVQK